jgi:hypothetical protein
MYAFLFGSWVMVGLWVVVSVILYKFSWQWATLMLFCTLSFGWYLRKVDARLDSQMTRTFDLKLDSDKIRLETFDVETGQNFERTLYWKEIRWAEVYRYVDEPTVILQGWDSFIEIPLWVFGTRRKSIMQALMARNIPVVRIP